MKVAGIQVRGLARSFGDVRAVRDATFRIEPGHVAGLVGPNGSGKTTLLLMLATLLAPDHGDISIGGVDPAIDPRGVRSKIGWMPDVLGTWPTLTVRQALATSARMYRINAESAGRRAAELIGLVDLTELADRPTRVLSRGQKQRLSLARALVHDPEVLLLDEPASGLDPSARADLRVLVRRLAAEGRTVLVSSHVLSELEEMADSAIYLTAGSTVDAESVARTATSRREWRIRSIDVGRLRSALESAYSSADLVSPATFDNLGALVLLASESHAASLLARLVHEGVPVSSFAPAVGDFEHAFLDLTREAPEFEEDPS